MDFLFNEIDVEKIEKLQNDPQFWEELDKLETQGIENKNIVQLYSVLDILLLVKSSEAISQRINKIYGVIIEEALSRLHAKLEAEEFLDLNRELDHYILRAVYEYGIDHYSKNNLHEAKEIFIFLSIITENNVFRGAMQIHLVSILTNISFQEFLNKFVDMEKMETENESFFMLYFKDEANRFLHANADLIKKAIREVEDLI
jgi:hypothetical protein